MTDTYRVLQLTTTKRGNDAWVAVAPWTSSVAVANGIFDEQVAMNPTGQYKLVRYSELRSN